MKRWRVRIAHGARAEIRRARKWWIEHRREAPDLFDRELAEALDVFEETPRLLALTTYPHRTDVRAYLLPVSLYRIYFSVSEQEGTVFILRLRHARRRPLR